MPQYIIQADTRIVSKKGVKLSRAKGNMTKAMKKVIGIQK